MQSLLAQIKQGLKAELYFLSLWVALCVPDICSALESKSGKTTGKQYRMWIEEYLIKPRPDKYGQRFSADDIWNFRCGLLHEGRTKVAKQGYKRIMFFHPIVNSNIHCCVVGKNTKDESLLIDLSQFCTDIVDGANKWFADKDGVPYISANLKNMIQLHPHGVAPVFGPVIG